MASTSQHREGVTPGGKSVSVTHTTIPPLKIDRRSLSQSGDPPTPNPGTPLNPPQNNGGIDPPALPPGSPDPVHDLPQLLLDVGWRKFWSRREGRPYFFNKFSNQTMWDMPPLESGQGERFDDPLGIETPSPSQVSTPGQQISPHQVGDKRRSSEEMSSPSPKKQASSIGPFWNFEIHTNVVMYERKPSCIPQPHPDTEQLRAQLVDKLRVQYNEMCMSREGINAPTGSFNRWLLERQTFDKGNDSMLPSQCFPEISNCMRKEIMNDIPVKLVKTKYTGDARRQLFKYAEAAKKLIEIRGTCSESRRIVKWNAEDTFTWLRGQSHSAHKDFLERLAHLKRQCQPHVTEAAKSSVEGICTKMYNISCDCVKRLQETHWKLLTEANIQAAPELPEPVRRKVMCYPVQHVVPPVRVLGVEHRIEGETVSLQYKGDVHKLNLQHFKKLEQLYRANAHDDQRFDIFLCRTWCMLRRYQTLFGHDEGNGSSGAVLQGALPVPVLECLHRVFHVTFECFASPLNCYFKQYSSAFSDTDACFGSRGSILQFHPVSGSFEANPPFCEELMEAMVDHFESLLQESQEPLSFIVFIPDWRDPPTEALIRLESSRFKRRQTLIEAHEHDYRHGFQHVLASKEVSIKAGHGTLVVFLQNDAGYARWAPTSQRIKELKLAFVARDSHSSPVTNT